jgi:hypothetical protein
MWFIPRRFVYQPVNLSEASATSGPSPQVFEDSEKGQNAVPYIQSPGYKFGTKHKKPALTAKVLILAFIAALALLSRHSFINNVALGYKAMLQNNKVHDQIVCTQPTSVDEPTVVIAAPPSNATALKEKASWGLYCSSAISPCSNLIDSDITTEWKSDTKLPAEQQSIIINLNASKNVQSLAMTPKPGRFKRDGVVTKHRVDVATARTGP